MHQVLTISGGSVNINGSNIFDIFCEQPCDVVDINITGGTYNPATGCATFYPNSGASFNVCGFMTGFTDAYTDNSSLSGTSIYI